MFLKSCREKFNLEIPIVVITDHEIHMQQAMELGADCFLIKPVSKIYFLDLFTTFKSLNKNREDPDDISHNNTISNPILSRSTVNYFESKLPNIK
jgi:FixJ family two-component response regulator